tara:strand:+ start:1192 stop:1995 length:804 start_codon:yes stop_codon:yes gene_type:complete
MDRISIYSSDSFQEINEVPIIVVPSTTREQNEIICMQKSDDEKYLAVIAGKNLVMNEQKHNQLFIFIKGDKKSTEFKQHTKLSVSSMSFFDNVCTVFYFKNDPMAKKINTIIFSKKDSIFEMNFDTKKTNTLYKFKTPLLSQPEFFCMNDKQNVFIVASPDDGLYYTSKKRSEVDLDDTFNIGCIKSALYDNKDSSFYILCNKFEGEYGIFLILFSQDNPNNHQFLVKCKNRLEIGDANISILTNKEAGYRELVIGYKVIHVNIYCV